MGTSFLVPKNVMILCQGLHPVMKVLTTLSVKSVQVSIKLEGEKQEKKMGKVVQSRYSLSIFSIKEKENIDSIWGHNYIIQMSTL